MAKILRKVQGSVVKIKCSCWPKNDITSFKILKVDLNFEKTN